MFFLIIQVHFVHYSMSFTIPKDLVIYIHGKLRMTVLYIDFYYLIRSINNKTHKFPENPFKCIRECKSNCTNTMTKNR